jgi:predicted permease
MGVMGRVGRRLGLLVRRKRFQSELAEEMRFHREEMEREIAEGGTSAEEARRVTRRRFGNETRLQERSHEVVRFGFEPVAQDVRYAVRQLRRNPGFFATTVVVLALGLFASTAIYAFVDAALVKPLPYQKPDRLAALYERIPVGDKYHLSYLDYKEWRQRNRVFSSLDVYRPEPVTVRGADGVEEVRSALVSDGFFRTLGVAPMLGRDFLPGEDEPSERVVLLSYGAWQRRFGEDRYVVGRWTTINGDPFRIVGVLPKEFHFAPVGRAEFWLTLRGRCKDNFTCFPFYGVARLKDGVSLATASQNLSGVSMELAREYPKSNRDRTSTVLPLAQAILGDTRPMLIALLSGAALLCLIGFVNVSSLLLVRTESRRREIAVREALGASRLRLTRQFIVEGFVLAACGFVAGLALTFFSLGALKGQIPANALAGMPYLEQMEWNVRIPLFAGVVAIAGGVLFAAAPLFHLLTMKMNEGLRDSGRSSSGRTWRRSGAGLVVVELAITVVLLVNAGLLAKSFYRLLHVEMGISAERLAMVHVLRLGKWDDDERNLALEKELVSRIARLPGVESVSVTGEPVVGSGEGFVSLFTHFRVAGRSYVGEGNEALHPTIGAGYLETLGARLLVGRFFATTDDRTRTRVAVINETMAREEFGSESPLGKQIINQYDPEHPVEIVGVVADLKDGALDSKPISAVYRPFDQIPLNSFYVTFRTSQVAGATLPAVAHAVREVDPGLIVNDEETMSDRISKSEAAYLHRSAAWLVSGFATTALLLGVVGLYGVIAYSVSQRTREIGVRMALGAGRRGMMRMVVGEAGWLASVGIAAGIVCSLIASRMMRGLLFGVSAWDVPTLVAVAVVLGCAALAASAVPARRAASVDPMEALRAE